MLSSTKISEVSNLLDFLKWGMEKNSSLDQVPKQLHVSDVSRQQQSVQRACGTKPYIQLIGISDMNLGNWPWV